MGRTTDIASSLMLYFYKGSWPVITYYSNLGELRSEFPPSLHWILGAQVPGCTGPFSTASENCPGRGCGRHLALLLWIKDEEIRLRAGKTPAYGFHFVLVFSAQTGLWEGSGRNSSGQQRHVTEPGSWPSEVLGANLTLSQLSLGHLLQAFKLLRACYLANVLGHRPCSTTQMNSWFPT